MTSSGTTLFAGAVEVRDYGTAAETVAFNPQEDICIVCGATSRIIPNHLNTENCRRAGQGACI